ncbi:MAG: GIY-YIG nuclease family protein [Clostridia bacterium]|nr:GIY-YIG nuclease family protein [Clostridia bacterium]
MIDFEKELESILNEDPLGLLEVKKKSSNAVTADERLVSSFEEINEFVRKNNREPEASRDIGERKLYSRLKGLRENPEKAVALVSYDSLNLLEGYAVLKDAPEIYTTEDILEHDPLGLLDDDPSNDILNLRHVTRKSSPPEMVAHRKQCDEFDQFEPLFKQAHAELKTKKKVTIPFRSQRQIEPGSMFILQGMLVYVGTVGAWEKKNFGNTDARLYCVFENGTESNMFLRSLAAAMWKDVANRQVIDADQVEMFNNTYAANSEDEATGSIYVLKSLCQRPEIRDIKDLYKIGYSSGPVKERIKNAASDPTYLMSEVKLVMEYYAYNLNPQKFEALLHRFFAEACLNVDIFDNDGKRHTPREWFVVPLRIIEIAVDLLISGKIVNYRYNAKKAEIEAVDE